MRLIAEVQKDIEITREPFYKSIKKLNMDYGEFFDTLNELKDSGIMRRFATILNHRRAGFRANAMSVWSVSEDRAEEIGEKIAEFRAVSHCYLRPKYPSWHTTFLPWYTLKDYETCDRILDEIGHEVGVHTYD